MIKMVITYVFSSEEDFYHQIHHRKCFGNFEIFLNKKFYFKNLLGTSELNVFLGYDSYHMNRPTVCYIPFPALSKILLIECRWTESS